MLTSTQPNGTLYIISAPSGAGKSSLIKAYLQSQHGHPATVAISHTTRAPRPGEVDGQHYYFVSKSEFEQMIAEQAFVEHAQVYDHYYGTSVMAVEQNLQNGLDVFLDIDWQGAQQVRKLRPDARSIFILPPSLTELEHRLVRRGQDSAEVIARRMQQAKAEMSHFTEYDYLLINDDFETALQQLIAIMQAERLTTAKQQQHQQSLLAALLD